MAAKKSKLKELTETLQRLQAEYENYRKRKEVEVEKHKQNANIDLIKRLLPVLDSFELALSNKSTKNLKQGLELIYSQFLSVLEDEGLEEINAEKFDPYLHEALLVEASDKPEGTIIEVFQKGYKIRGTVLRPAKVKVAKNADIKTNPKK